MEKSIRFKDSSSQLLAFLLMAMMMMMMMITASSEPEVGCTETLMEISPCLPYISSSPNNLSSSASTLCCEFFSAASDSGNATCLCYLIRQPFIFGFPLNTTKISSLFFVCPLGNEMDPGTRTPLDSLCEAVSENSPSPMPTLPTLAPSPVTSLATAPVPRLAPAPVPSISASHMPSLPQEPAASSTIPTSPSEDIGTDSSTSDPVSSSSAKPSTSEPVCCCSCSYYFRHGMIMLLTVYIIMYL